MNSFLYSSIFIYIIWTLVSKHIWILRLSTHFRRHWDTRHQGAINHRVTPGPYRLEWYTNTLVTLIDRDILYSEKYVKVWFEFKECKCNFSSEVNVCLSNASSNIISQEKNLQITSSLVSKNIWRLKCCCKWNYPI